VPVEIAELKVDAAALPLGLDYWQQIGNEDPALHTAAVLSCGVVLHPPLYPAQGQTLREYLAPVRPGLHDPPVLT